MNAPRRPARRAEPHVMNTYGRLPFALSHGQGCRVWDTERQASTSTALGGIAVNTLGHAHPKLVPALQDQIGKLIHSSQLLPRAAAGDSWPPSCASCRA